MFPIVDPKVVTITKEGTRPWAAPVEDTRLGRTVVEFTQVESTRVKGMQVEGTEVKGVQVEAIWEALVLVRCSRTQNQATLVRPISRSVTRLLR